MTIMNDINVMMQRLEAQRDELRLKMHLAEMDCRDEWKTLESRFEDLQTKVKETSTDVGELTNDTWQGLKVLGEEIAEAFRCLRKDL